MSSSLVLFNVIGEEVHEKLAGDKRLQVVLDQILKDPLCAIRAGRLDFIDVKTNKSYNKKMG